MNANRGRSLGIWVGLLIANLVLLSLGHRGAPTGSFAAFRVTWMIANLMVGVVVFPTFAIALLVRWFRENPIRQWTAATMLLFDAGVLLVAFHLFAGTLWMVHRTDVLPQGLSRSVHALLSYGYTVFAPVLIVITVFLWAKRRGDGGRSSHKR